MTFDPLIAATHSLGLMAISGISFGIIQRKVKTPFAMSAIVGLVFSTAAILAMLQPWELSPGVYLDARSVIVGLAAAFGGFPAAILSVLLVGAARIAIGGVGTEYGVSGIIACAVLGYCWRRLFWTEHAHKPRHLIGLGGLLALHAVTVFILPIRLAIDLSIVMVPTLIVSSFIGAFIMGSLIERERKYLQTENHWRQNASTDPLTGLPNRRAFAAALDDITPPRSPLHSGVFMIIDADHFKTVNDTYGHEAGDAALKHVAECLRQSVRPGDKLCRFGGEEFGVLIPSISRSLIAARAEDIRRKVAENPVVFEGRTIHLTVSIGVAQRSGPHVTAFHSMMRDADLALYKAKATGRNCVSVSDDPHALTRDHPSNVTAGASLTHPRGTWKKPRRP
ncbi:diguanylate cyclase [Loktanella atrilutea]|uniref:diguanylate cyclase n=1 Tax=Loktanella atrilutea TaxID=366533 RepID=A0A1M5EV28_LOKAT|nr:diguanylate cyclase [Loktanella atrilutea]SHF83078.1 diguanylate cyclase [Loktanella atrilutea]